MYQKISITVKNLLLRPIFKDLSWYTLAQVFVQGTSFFSVIIVSRYLGPINLGLYSFVINYVGAFLTVIGGMDFYFTWKLAKSKNPYEDFKIYLGHKFNIYIVISLVGLISAWYVLPKDVATLVSIILVTISFQSLNTFLIYAVINNRAKLVATVQMINAGLMLLLKVALVFLKASLLWFVAISALDLILAGLIFSTYFLRIPEWRKVFSSFKLPSFLSSFIFLYSIRLSVISLVCFQLLLRADQLILATFSNAYTLGIYSSAVRISDVPNFLAGILSNALASRIAYISTKNDEVSKKNFKKIMFYYIGVGFFVFFVFLIFAPLAVKILYGSKFIESVPVLRTYALSIPAMFTVAFFINVYGVKDRYHHQIAIFGSSLLLNIILVYVLTPIYGLVGTALATVFAYTLSALLFYFNLENKKQ